MAGRVDEVELVSLAVLCRIRHADRLELDRDPTLPLQIHRVEDLVLHVALADRSRVLEEAVGQRRLAVVDVGDDAEVPHQRLPGRNGHVRENTHVAVVLAIGVALSVAGLVLLLNLFGAGDHVIRSVTSRDLGSLPPGFAASKRGFRIYAVLVIAVGVLCLGLAATTWLLPLGAAMLVAGAVTVGIAPVGGVARGGETGPSPKNQKRARQSPPPAGGAARTHPAAAAPPGVGGAGRARPG